MRSSRTRSGLAWWNAAMAWSPERTNTGSKPSWRRTMPSISPSDGSSSTTSTLPLTPTPSSLDTVDRGKDVTSAAFSGVLGRPQPAGTALTGSGGLVTMRPSADERKAVSSQPPPWGPPPGPPQGPPGWGPPSPGSGPPSPYPPLPKAGSARTGPLPLHPMTFGDILDGSFKLLKANLRTIVLVSAVFLIPVNLVAAFFQRDVLGGHGFLRLMNDPSLLEQAANTGPSNAALVGAVLAVLASILVTPFVGGAVSRVVASSYLGDELAPGAAM